MLQRGPSESAKLSFTGLRILQVDANLDQLLSAVDEAGEKVDLVSVLGSHVGLLSATPVELQRDCGLQRVPDVRPS